jgi:hypothetical protein
MSDLKAPKGLGPSGKALWEAMTAVFDFSEDPHRVNLLEELCRTKDLCVRISQTIDNAADLRVPGSRPGMKVVMGEVSELRGLRAVMVTITKAMGLPDTEELAEVKRTHLSLVRSAARSGKKRAVY